MREKYSVRNAEKGRKIWSQIPSPFSAFSPGSSASLSKKPDPSVLLPHSRPAVQHHCRPPFLLLLITISLPSTPATPPSSQTKEETKIAEAAATWQREPSPFRRSFRPPQATISDATTTKRTTSESSTQRC